MNIWAVIPTKPFDKGKGRLAAILSPHDRRALNRRFFEHTLKVALDVFSPDRVVAISQSAEALAIVEHRRAHALTEPQLSDLNTALTTASQFARDAGAEGVLSISCDLPLLTVDDLCAMLRGAAHFGVSIAGDRERVGTNAMLVAPAGLIDYRFGEESFAAHNKAANLTGKTAVLVDRPGLAFDVDTPMDLKTWLAKSSPSPD